MHKRVREMIQTALNLVNGIAFGSHEPRFKGKYAANKTPGPGDYEVSERYRLNRVSRSNKFARKTLVEKKLRDLLEQRKNAPSLVEDNSFF